MWRYSDFVRSPNRKTTNDFDLEMIAWSWNEFEAKDLIRAHCFPTVVCLAQTLDDEAVRLEAGMVLELHGSIKSDLKLLCNSTIENINNYKQQKNNRISRHASELQRFKSREISTIDEEEETAGTLRDLQKGLVSVKVTCGDEEDDDDVLVAGIIGGWLPQGEVLLLPCCLRPKFKLPLKPPKLSEREWEDTLGMLLRSSGSIDLDECFWNLVEPEHQTMVPDHRRLSQNFNVLRSNTTSCDVIEVGERFETLLPNSTDNKKDGVRRMKSMFSLYDDFDAIDGRCLENKHSSSSSSCANLNKSIISLFSSSNLSLNSNVHGSELLNILRPKNYKRQTSETAPKPKSRFSIFRAKKSKKSKHEQSTEDVRSTQNELMKAKRYVDLLDVVGKPKSSDCSVMGSILNLSDLSHVVSCANSFVDLSSTKHLSMPCDIDKIRGGKAFHNPQSFRPLALENYMINKSETPSETSIARKKKMKTNLRMKNKFGSQVLSKDSDSEYLKRQAIYADDFSKSMENVKWLEVLSPRSETKERPAHRLGISMAGVKVDSEMCTNDLSPKEDVSRSIAHISIHEPPHQTHPHPVIRTNPHHTNRRNVKKSNAKQFSKSTLSTDDDFQFVRLLSVRKTCDNNPSHHYNLTPNNSRNNSHNNSNANNEVIYENIGFTSDASFHDSLAPVESLDSRTNSTESSDYVNSDSSFGGAIDHPCFTTSKMGNQQDKRSNRFFRFYDDDGYQSSMDIVDQFSNNSNNCPFASELVSYL